MAAPDAGSSAQIRTTFAPFVRHESACERIFWALPCALLIVAVTPAALNALVRYGRSKSSQRTDVLVSGRRTQTCALADCFELFADALATTIDAAIITDAIRKSPQRVLRFMKSSG